MILAMYVGEHGECADAVNPQVIPGPRMKCSMFTSLLPQTRSRMAGFGWWRGGSVVRAGRSLSGALALKAEVPWDGGQVPSRVWQSDGAGPDAPLCILPEAPRLGRAPCGQELGQEQGGSLSLGMNTPEREHGFRVWPRLPWSLL